MQFSLTFKDPDGVYDSLEAQGLDINNLPQEIKDLLYKYLEFNEVVTILFDSETGTASVEERDA